MKTDIITRKIIESGSLTAAVFGLLGWIYIVLCRFITPNTLEVQLSHLTPWIREDTFGMLCFVISAIGFFTWYLVKEK